jgi:hypothetical protein
MERVGISRGSSFLRFAAGKRIAATAVTLVALGGVAVPAASAKKKLLAANAVTLIHAGGETCFGPTLPGAPTQSTATITANNSTVSATVNLINAQRSTTYNVMLSTCRNGILQKTGFQFVPTNASGNGTTSTPITVPRGTSTGAIITALPLDGSGLLLAAPNVVPF